MAPKVKLKRSVVDRVAGLAAEAGFPAPVRLGAVAGPLSALSEADALGVLDVVVRDVDPADPSADPTAAVCRLAAAKAQGGAPSGPVAEAGAAAEGIAKEAGADAAAAAEAAPDAAPEADAAADAPKKVRLRRCVVERVRELNADGGLAAQLRLPVVAGPLAELDEAFALSLLDSLAEEGDAIPDPTAWVVKAARREAAWAVAEEEEWKEWESWEEQRAGDLAAVLAPKVLEKVRAINRSGLAAETLVLAAIAGPLALLEEGTALRVLEQFEAEGLDVEEGNYWINRRCFWLAGRVMTRVDKLNRRKAGKMDLLARVSASEVRDHIRAISESSAFDILDELESKAVEIPDPTAWIIEAAKKQLSASPLAQQVNQLNASGKLAQPLEAGPCIDALAKLKGPTVFRLLGDLRRRGKALARPTGFLLAQARRELAAEQAAAAKPPAEAPPMSKTGIAPRPPWATRAAWSSPARPPASAKALASPPNAPGKRLASPTRPPGQPTQPPAQRLASPTRPPAQRLASPTRPPAQRPPGPRPPATAPPSAAVPPAAAEPTAPEPPQEEVDPEMAAAEEEAAWRAMRDAFGDTEELPPRPARRATGPASKRAAAPPAKRAAAPVPKRPGAAADAAPAAKRARKDPAPPPSDEGAAAEAAAPAADVGGRAEQEEAAALGEEEATPAYSLGACCEEDDDIQ